MAALADGHQHVAALSNGDQSAVVELDDVFIPALFGKAALSQIAGRAADQGAADGAENARGAAFADLRTGHAAGDAADCRTERIVAGRRR